MSFRISKFGHNNLSKQEVEEKFKMPQRRDSNLITDMPAPPSFSIPGFNNVIQEDDEESYATPISHKNNKKIIMFTSESEEDDMMKDSSSNFSSMLTSSLRMPERTVSDSLDVHTPSSATTST